MHPKLTPRAAFTTFAALAIVGIAAVVWNRSSRPGDRQELSSVPGASVSREGTSIQTDLFSEALALMARRNFVGAESVYREILQREPMSAPAFIGLGTARFHQNDVSGAQEYYRRALEIDPFSAGAAL
jgi:Tfp pilus assembly protein PilF